MAQTLFASMGTASWIDPATKLRKVDPVAPPANVARSFLCMNGDHDRFSNYLEVYIEVEGGKIAGGGFSAASGLYRAPSAFGLDSVPYPTRQNVGRSPDVYTFTQIVGARTHSPETVGEGAGTLIGAGAGFGVAAVSAPFLATPLAPLAVVGVIGGAGVGYLAGKFSAKKIFSYPPIWSELVLKFYGAGTMDAQVMRHSLFPSLTAFRQDGEPKTRPASSLHRVPSVTGSAYYDANANLPAWQSRGWGAWRGGSIGPTPGNPWGAELSDFEQM